MHIVRAIVGIIAGYLIILVVTIGTLFAMYSVGGAEFAFKPQSWEASTAWAAISVASGLIAAIVAGYVCYLISSKKGVVLLFAGVLLLIGIITSGSQLAREKSVEPRPAEMDFVAAGEKAYSPDWYNYAIPVVGVIGVIIGGTLIGGKNDDE